MEADPDVVITYAPWLLYDLVDAAIAGPVLPGAAGSAHRARPAWRTAGPHPAPPHLPGDLRRAAPTPCMRLMPRVNDIAFYAFAQAADYLAQGAVLHPRAALLRVDHTLLRRREPLAGGQRRGRDRLGPLPRRSGIPDGPRRRRHRRRGARRLPPAHPADDRGAHVGGHPLAPLQPSATRSTPTRWPCACRAWATSSLLHVPLSTLASQATLHFLLHDEALNRGRDQADLRRPLRRRRARATWAPQQTRRWTSSTRPPPAEALHERGALRQRPSADASCPAPNDAQARNLHVVRDARPVRALRPGAGLTRMIDIHPTARDVARWPTSRTRCAARASSSARTR